jgi:FkbM family methyltransferase
MFNRRLALLTRVLEGRADLADLSVLDILYNIFGPVSRFKARPFLRSITEPVDGLRAVYFHGYEAPLYLPADLDPSFIYQIICELFRPEEWHYYETPETRVTANDYVLDAGAAEGLFTYLTASRARQLYAVEPLPAFIHSMTKSFSSLDNVEIIAAALGAETGQASLSGSGIGTVIVPDQTGSVIITTVDELIIHQERPLSYLKADLEGYERAMLAGARESIIRYRPKIAITTYHRQDDHKFFMSFLESLNLGYQFRCRGIEERWGQPVMLHAWVSSD